MPLIIESSMLDRITVVDETDTEYNPVFDIYYVDKVDDESSPLVRGREAALAFARKLAGLYNWQAFWNEVSE